MNKNSVIGFVLIGAILIAFSWYNSKIYNEQQKIEAQKDSVAAVKLMEEQSKLQKETPVATQDSLVAESNLSGATDFYKDSLLNAASKAPEQTFFLENDKIKVELTSLGAQIKDVLVKNYYTYDSLDLHLVRAGKSNFELQFYTNQQLTTSGFSFKGEQLNDSTVSMKLFVDENSYIEYLYKLPSDSYMLSMDVNMFGMNKHIPRNMTSLDLFWKLDVPRLEKGYDNEKNYSTIVYKFPNSNGVEDLGLRKDNSEEEIRTKLQWFAFQQQFFSAILVAKDNFTGGSLEYTVAPEGDPDKTLMHCSAKMQIPYSGGESVSIPMEFYFGPNKFKTLKSYNYGFENIVPLGGWIIGWINRYVIILVFDVLSNFISNFGIIILILTLLIKLVISPLTIKSYLSSAKMRVLKPEVDKINAKYPNSADAMKKQQETMALYSKTGVSMFGGCLPMLLQFPILFAMFRFFPASFELRQQGFLWADDLSAFDSVLNLPFTIPLYGDHVSLFALLMAVSMYFYSRMNMDQMSAGPQMAGMKIMSLYFMPIFLLVLCNNFSSGLSYYYMLSNVITMIQTWVIRRYFVDEEKIYAKLKEKAAGPSKKSKFQQRLDEVYKAQQQKNKQQR